MDLVKNQIESLASGTSSSHNRIKTEQLLDLLVPAPDKCYSNLMEDIKKVKDSLNKIYESKTNIISLDKKLNNLFNKNQQ